MGRSGLRIFSRTLLLVLVLTLACAGVASANTFSDGQFVTYSEVLWAGNNPGAALLFADFGSVYTSTLRVGLPGTGFALLFDTSDAILAYLPASGTPAALTGSLVDPTSSSAGEFGGWVLALQLNVDFNNAGFLTGTSGILFGNLVLQNLSTCSQLNGLTVSQFLAIDKTALGGGSTTCSIANLDALTVSLDLSFGSGSVSSFAQNNLALPGSVTSTPEPSSLLLLGSGLAGLGFLRRRFLRT